MVTIPHYGIVGGIMLAFSENVHAKGAEECGGRLGRGEEGFGDRGEGAVTVSIRFLVNLSLV